MQELYNVHILFLRLEFILVQHGPKYNNNDIKRIGLQHFYSIYSYTFRETRRCADKEGVSLAGCQKGVLLFAQVPNAHNQRDRLSKAFISTPAVYTTLTHDLSHF